MSGTTYEAQSEITCERGLGRMLDGRCAHRWREANGKVPGTSSKRMFELQQSKCAGCPYGKARAAAGVHERREDGAGPREQRERQWSDEEKLTPVAEVKGRGGRKALLERQQQQPAKREQRDTRPAKLEPGERMSLEEVRARLMARVVPTAAAAAEEPEPAPAPAHERMRAEIEQRLAEPEPEVDAEVDEPEAQPSVPEPPPPDIEPEPLPPDDDDDEPELHGECQLATCGRQLGKTGKYKPYCSIRCEREAVLAEALGLTPETAPEPEPAPEPEQPEQLEPEPAEQTEQSQEEPMPEVDRNNIKCSECRQRFAAKPNGPIPSRCPDCKAGGAAHSSGGKQPRAREAAPAALAVTKPAPELAAALGGNHDIAPAGWPYAVHVRGFAVAVRTVDDLAAVIERFGGS